MSVVIGTKFRMQLLCHTVYVCQFPCFCHIYIYSEICRIIDIKDGHFKNQDGGHVPCQYQLHTNLYIINILCVPILVDLL